MSITPFPALHRGTGTRMLTVDVLVALIPSVLAGVWLFGLRAAAVLAVCVVLPWRPKRCHAPCCAVPIRQAT